MLAHSFITQAAWDIRRKSQKLEKGPETPVSELQRRQIGRFWVGTWRRKPKGRKEKLERTGGSKIRDQI